MAAAEGNLRDVTEGYSHPFPSGDQHSQLDHETPGYYAGSFSYMSAQDAYPSMREIAEFDHTDLSQNPAYSQYMRMHKVLVGNHGAQQLELIHDELSRESMPHYLVSAGWAAAESALVRSDRSTTERLALLNKGLGSWHKALAMQVYIEAVAPEDKIEYAYGHRIALDIAIAPLLADIIRGDVRPETARQAFVDCLNVAQSNAVCIELASREENTEALAAHLGLGYECNGLLAFNREFSSTWFVVPSMARCDSGYFYRNQTHDLIVVHQKYGVIKHATPIEVKAKPSARDRARYDALLVRGKMHLCVEGKYAPNHTLQAIAADFEGIANQDEIRIAETATRRIKSMVRDYYAGEALGQAVGRSAITVFHDAAQVIAHHPGLSRIPAA